MLRIHRVASLISFSRPSIYITNTRFFKRVVNSRFNYLLLSNIQVVTFSTSSVINSKVMSFADEKSKYLNMSLDQKRSQYLCKSKYVLLEDVPTWSEYGSSKFQPKSSEYVRDETLNTKISLFCGDITALEIDCIVNAANDALRAGGGVCGAIHKAAGPKLQEECSSLRGCPTGSSKITGGYKLPAKYVIHAVGPIGEKPDLLKSCYFSSLSLAKENNLKSIAFPCISTGIFGYPNENAAHIVLKTVRDFLEGNKSSMDRVILCLFLPVDIKIYESLMQQYFPL